MDITLYLPKHYTPKLDLTDEVTKTEEIVNPKILTVASQLKTTSLGGMEPPAFWSSETFDIDQKNTRELLNTPSNSSHFLELLKPKSPLKSSYKSLDVVTDLFQKTETNHNSFQISQSETDFHGFDPSLHQDLSKRYTLALDIAKNFHQGPTRAVATATSGIGISYATGSLVELILSENPYGICAVGASLALTSLAEKLEKYLPKDPEKVIGYTLPYFDGPLMGQEAFPITGYSLSVLLNGLKMPGEFFTGLISDTSDAIVFLCSQVGITDPNIHEAWQYIKIPGSHVKKAIEDLKISPETLEKVRKAVIADWKEAHFEKSKTAQLLRYPEF